MKTIGIFGGGTISKQYPHLALCAPAYGGTAKKLAAICRMYPSHATFLYLSKMCGDISFFETNSDLQNLIDKIKGQLNIIFMPVSVCDFDLSIIDHQDGKRLSSKFSYKADLVPAPKIIKTIRDQNHKNIYVVQFKVTVGADLDRMYKEGINALKTNHTNLVLVNDILNKQNLIVTPEGGRYGSINDRQKTLEQLVSIAILRSGGTFNQTQVLAGNKIDLSSHLINPVFRQVLQYCVLNNMYEELDNGTTPGHFATKVDKDTFFSSIRYSNYNKEVKMVMVKIAGDQIISYGAKPSAGAKSQKQIFLDHPNMDFIIHFHKEPNKSLNSAVQFPYECGSLECGINTSNNLRYIDDDRDLLVVHLEQHGPNIVFNKRTDPNKVISFIREYYQ